MGSGITPYTPQTAAESAVKLAPNQEKGKDYKV
jgi:hypothetical protein